MNRARISEILTGTTSSWYIALIIGLVLGFFLILAAIIHSALIFSGGLAPFAAQGVGLLLFGAFALCLIVALTSSFRGALAFPQESSAVVLGTIAVAVAAAPMGSGKDLFSTMVAIIIISSLLTGAVFLFIGWYRLANFMRFLPYPVVGGFLAGVGWFMLIRSLPIMTGAELDWDKLPSFFESGTIWKWALGTAYGVLLYFGNKFRPHFLLLPLSMVAMVGVYYVVLFSLGYSLDDAKEAGQLLSGLPDGRVWPAFGLGDLTASVDWGMVLTQLPAVLVVLVISLFSMMMEVNSLEITTGTELDLNREFRASGWGGIVAGLGGSSPGWHSLALSNISRLSGARTALTGVIAALVAGCMLFFGGAIIAVVPMQVVGGVVLFLGLTLVDDWLIAAHRSMPLADYVMVLFVFLPIVFLGFLEGVIIGLVATIIFFVIRFSVVETIDSAFSGRQRQSMRIRPIPHQVILLEHGEQIRGYQVRGYFFFGSAARTLDTFRSALAIDPVPRCLLLDFSRVSGVDISAIVAFHRFIATAELSGVKIVISSMPKRFQSDLRRVLPSREWQSLDFAQNLDQGLERCEDILIEDWEEIYSTQGEARSSLFDLSVDWMAQRLDSQAVFEDLMERLQPWLLVYDYAAGQSIAARGERAEGMQLLAAGRAAAQDLESNARLAEYGPGDVLTPQGAFGDYAVDVDILAEQPCHIMLLTPAARRALERDDPALALELDRYVMSYSESS